MTDIVERLRDAPLPDWKTLVDLCNEAADEIERLRAALERIANSFDGETGDAKIARAALQKDEGE